MEFVDGYSRHPISPRIRVLFTHHLLPLQRETIFTVRLRQAKSARIGSDSVSPRFRLETRES